MLNILLFLLIVALVVALWPILLIGGILALAAFIALVLFFVNPILSFVVLATGYVIWDYNRG